MGAREQDFAVIQRHHQVAAFVDLRGVTDVGRHRHGSVGGIAQSLDSFGPGEALRGRTWEKFAVGGARANAKVSDRGQPSMGGDSGLDPGGTRSAPIR